MKNKTSQIKMKEEITEIQKKLCTIGPMLPGSISYQYQACGKKGCKCKDPENPQRHGPYAKLFYVHKGKKACRFVRADCVEPIKARLDAYKSFRKLTDRWIELSINIAQDEFFAPPPSKSPHK